MHLIKGDFFEVTSQVFKHLAQILTILQT